jgi:hypothetical protein
MDDAAIDSSGLLPALCFFQQDDPFQVVEPGELPPGAPSFTGQRLLWPPGRVQVVNVKSNGALPDSIEITSDAPPERVLRQRFAGEPRSAEGVVCAVKDRHADVAAAPLIARDLRCVPETGEPCVRHMLLAFRGSGRFSLETYHCPDPTSSVEACELTSTGDAWVKREWYEHVLGMTHSRVLFLVEPAPAGSFTAWRFGAPQGLPAGYHVFDAIDWHEQDTCVLEAYSRATQDALPQFEGHFQYDPRIGLPTVEPEYAAAYNDEVERRSAKYQMESCDLPEVRPVSIHAVLSLHINSELPFKAFF